MFELYTKKKEDAVAVSIKYNGKLLYIPINNIEIGNDCFRIWDFRIIDSAYPYNDWLYPEAFTQDYADLQPYVCIIFNKDITAFKETNVTPEFINVSKAEAIKKATELYEAETFLQMLKRKFGRN